LDYYGSMISLKRLTLTTLLMAATLQTSFAATPPEDTVNNSSLNSALFYQLLVGEMSAQSGDTASAYSLMLDAARKGNSERLYERAVELALASRNGESALQAAQAWARAFPKSPEANRYVIQILVGLNKLGELPEAIQRGVSTAPTKERGAAIATISRYVSRATNKPLAASVMEQGVAAELGNPVTGPAAWSAIGALRLLAGDNTGAVEAARRGNALNVKSDDLAALALALMDAKVPEGEDMIRKTLAGKASPEIRIAYVRRLLDAQRNAEAYSQVQTLTQQAPEFADGWIVRGSLEVQDKKTAAAEASLKQYVGLVTANTGNTDSVTTDRGLVQAYLLLAQLAEQDKRFDDARAYLDRIDSSQDVIRVQTRRANLLAKQGKMNEARELLRGTPELQPSDARAKLNAEVQLLRDYKLFAQAYALLAQALQRDPKDADLAYDQAMVAEKLGENAEMERLLRQVIAAKPDYHHAYNALGYGLADRGTNLPEARQLITKALEFAPNDPFIIDSLGWVEFRSGNLGEAQRLLKGAYQSRPDAEIAAHLGEVLWAMGRKTEAQAVWQEGMALNADNETLLETMKRLVKQ
jgi:tetratricopeptide (TPR) repeat protein